MRVIEHLASTGKQHLDMFPYPRGPIAHHTQAHLVCGNHAGVLDLLARLAEVGLIVPLMPTAQRHDATCSDEIQAKGIRLRRDSWVSVMYAEALNSTTSSVTLQRTDRHGILVRQVALKRK